MTHRSLHIAAVLVACLALYAGGQSPSMADETAAAGSVAHPLKLGEGKPPEPPPEVDKPAPEPPKLPGTIQLREFLTLPMVGRYARAALHVDPVELAIVHGAWKSPAPDDTVTAHDGQIRKWTPAKAADNGSLDTKSLRGGYAYAKINSPAARTMLLEARGHATVFVNSVPRAGDAYSQGILRLPVRLVEGDNHLLFHIAGEKFQARLVEPKSELLLQTADMTLPDLLAGESGPLWGAVVVINATTEATRGVSLVVHRAGAQPARVDKLVIAPMSVRKIGFPVPGDGKSSVRDLEIRLVRTEKNKQEKVLDTAKVSLRTRRPGETQIRTFKSDIDGSVQKYALRPAKPTPGGTKTPGVILTLHGAGVEAAHQADQYANKPWAHVVAPTNRRPFGFDWEDWGRIDAVEALSDVQQRLDTDQRRVFLTGHSMGGHGCWHLGACYPDRFAAIGPSAGWFSFWSYGRMPKIKDPTPREKLLLLASNPSDTLKQERNFAHLGVYILHGAADTNVPVAQARFMRGQLAKFHPNFAYYEKPGAGHWWGSQCCDWTPMMQFFEHQQIPKPSEKSHIELVTTNPGVTSRSHWIGIEAQEQQFDVSRVSIGQDLATRKFTGSTKNVARMSIDLAHLEPDKPVNLEFDGQRFQKVRWPAASKRLWLTRREDRWVITGEPNPAQKNPARYGLFKDVLRRRVIFVYGTKGKPEENAWSLAKARYDAETFYYRGNGSIRVVADTQFDEGSDKDRNVLLYGNADTNGAWPALLSTCPVQVRRGVVYVGSRPESGDDLCCLMIRPRPGSDVASVGVVAGTGLVGMRATNRLRYFVSGVAYPDLLLFSAGSLAGGNTEIRTAGIFGLDWSLETGQFAWRDLAL